MKTRKEKKLLQTRFQVKDYFKNGSIPTEVHFGHLIDSMSNKLDDGYAKDPNYGLMLSPTAETQRFISFFENIDARIPYWNIGRHRKDATGLGLTGGTEHSGLNMKEDAKVGISNHHPKFALDIGGFAGMEGVVGTHQSGEIDADGTYHDVLSGLSYCQAYEVIARVGKKGTGRYALLRALALSVGGKNYGRIRKSCATYGWFWNRLQIRWQGEQENYQLQLRSRTSYGTDENGDKIKVKYHITKLWDDDTMNDDE